MSRELEELDARLAELRQTIEALPEAMDEEQQAALDGLNELVRIFEKMRASTAAFMARHGDMDETKRE